jgi:hypothetical protein
LGVGIPVKTLLVGEDWGAITDPPHQEVSPWE